MQLHLCKLSPVLQLHGPLCKNRLCRSSLQTTCSPNSNLCEKDLPVPFVLSRSSRLRKHCRRDQASRMKRARPTMCTLPFGWCRPEVPMPSGDQPEQGGDGPYAAWVRERKMVRGVRPSMSGLQPGDAYIPGYLQAGMTRIFDSGPDVRSRSPVSMMRTGGTASSGGGRRVAGADQDDESNPESEMPAARGTTAAAGPLKHQ
jgi:hypothetical protein